MKRKIKVINGKTYEECGPYCMVCGTHMGMYYNPSASAFSEEKMFINPHGYEQYSENTCPGCGQEYEYEEGNQLVLTKEQLAFIKEDNLKRFTKP